MIAASHCPPILRLVFFLVQDWDIADSFPCHLIWDLPLLEQVLNPILVQTKESAATGTILEYSVLPPQRA
jgi:hypothetical protein